MTIKHWWRAFAVMCATIAIALAAGYEIAKASPSRAELPPECISAPIADYGATIFVKWCGTGSAGEFPLKAGVHSLTTDGVSALTPKNCPRANPCIVLWPGSFRS